MSDTMEQRTGSIDGLRGIAAAMVLLSHVAFWTGASAIDFSGGLLARGESGVAIFFAISSFLLLRPWIRAGLDHGRPPNLGRYARHRLARILPAYWVALAAVIAVAATLHNIGGCRMVLAHVVVLQGFTGHLYQSFSQTWSLTTEVTFYALVPLLGAAIRSALARPDGARRVIVLLAVIAVGGVGLQGFAASSGHGILATSVVGHAAWFSVGAGLCLWREGQRRGLWAARVPEQPSQWAMSFVVVYLAASSPLAGPRDLAMPSWASASTREGCYAVLATLALAIATSPTVVAARGPLYEWAGRLSYGVFLWHVLVLQVIYSALGLPLFSGLFWWVLILTAVVSCGLAWASATLVEAPALRWAHQRAVPAPRH